MLRKIGVYADRFRMLLKKECLLLSMYFTLVAVYYRHVNLNPAGKEFDRTFNQMIFSGQSLSGRLSGVNTLIFIYFPLMFILSYFLFSFLVKKDSVYFRIMNECAGLFCCILPLYFLSRYDAADRTINEAPLVNLSLLIILVLLIGSYVDKKRKLDASAIYATLLLSVSEVVSFRLLFHTNSQATFYIKHSEYICALLFLLQIIFLVFVNMKHNREFVIIKVLAAIMAWIPFVIMVRVEFFYIAAGKGSAVNNQYNTLLFTVIVFILIAGLISVGVLYLVHKSNLLKSVASWRIGYVGLILGIAALNWFPVFSTTFNINSYAAMFEMGNYSAVAETISYGQLPVVNYFSAHLLSDMWTRGLYYLLNGDMPGVLAGNYLMLEMVVQYVIFYVLLNRLFGKDKAFWLVFLLPVCIHEIMWSSVNLLAIIALFYVVKRNNWLSYIAFWAALLFGVLYKLDTGYSIGIGCVVLLFVLVICKKVIVKWIPFLLSALGVAGAFLIYFIIGCVKEGVSVVSRIWEFVSVTLMSNSTWALRTVADQVSREFFLIYVLIPVVTLIMIVVTFCKRKEVTDEQLPLFSIILVLGISQLLTMPRILVLHTYNNDTAAGVLVSFFHLLAACFVAFVFRYKENIRMIMFFVTFVSVVYLEGVFINGFLPTLNSSPGIYAYDNSEMCSIAYDESMGTKRAVFTDDTVVFLNEFEVLFDTILEEDETFLDFSNITGLYAFVGRENPAYVSQLPSLLTTEYSQRCLIEEIERHGKVEVALLANREDYYIDGMIGIKHPIRYYLVAEYIYNNFVPLTTVGDFAVWCRKDSYEYMSEQLAYIGKDIIDYNYADKSVLHTYTLGQIPLYWANYDTGNAIASKELYVCKEKGGNRYSIGQGTIRKETGNYLALKVNHKEQGCGDAFMCLRDKEGNMLAEFVFDVIPGEWEYVIRISSDFMWYSGMVDYVDFTFEKDCEVSHVRVLEGD